MKPLDVLCPRCGSSPGTPCVGVLFGSHGTPMGVVYHQSRHDAAPGCPLSHDVTSDTCPVHECTCACDYCMRKDGDR